MELPVFCLMPSLFCNRSKELLRLKWSISGSSLRKFCLSNSRELAKKILVSFTFGLARQIFGFPRFSTITFLFCNCLGPRNTRWISTFAAKILLCWNKPENGNKFHSSLSLTGPTPFENAKRWLGEIHSNCIHAAKLAISNLVLLIPCMEFEIFWVQIPLFEVFWMCH